MNLQSTLDPLRLCLERKALRVYMGKYQVAIREYIYVNLTCSTTFCQNLNFCTTQFYFL
jgi:hypothetical protein